MPTPGDANNHPRPANQQVRQPASKPASQPARKGSPRARILSNWVAKKKTDFIRASSLFIRSQFGSRFRASSLPTLCFGGGTTYPRRRETYPRRRPTYPRRRQKYWFLQHFGRIHGKHTPDDVKHTTDDVKHTPDDVKHTPDDLH